MGKPQNALEALREEVQRLLLEIEKRDNMIMELKGALFSLAPKPRDDYNQKTGG